MQIDGVTRLITRFINFQRYTVRAHSPLSIAVVLPAVACPKTNATDDISVRIANFQTVGTPLNRESHFARFTCGKIQFLFSLYEIFLIVLRLPALALFPVPEVIPTFAN